MRGQHMGLAQAGVEFQFDASTTRKVGHDNVASARRRPARLFDVTGDLVRFGHDERDIHNSFEGSKMKGTGLA
ncbi:hypothetical protein BST61_g11167 [Cercospora zeina]